METEGIETKAEQITIRYCIAGIPVTRLLRIIALVILFAALCVVVFAGEPEPPGCDLQSGLPATLNLSQKQCEKIRQLTDRFRKDTAGTRAKIMEKRLELRRLSEDPKADPYAISKAEQELNALEKELFRRAYRTEVDQRRLLTPEQINKIKDIPSGYGSQGYGRRGYGRQ